MADVGRIYNGVGFVLRLLQEEVFIAYPPSQHRPIHRLGGNLVPCPHFDPASQAGTGG